MTGKTAFETRYGFARNQVLLGNWRENPFNRWSFQNVGELVPSARVAAAPGGVEAPAQDLERAARRKGRDLPGGAGDGRRLSRALRAPTR